MTKADAFRRSLLEWYDHYARDLPWRRNSSPYRIWVSEMMLQQTRVDTVIPYYLRFLEAFPDMETLAEADEDRLLKIWQGLGYYSRVRNMKKAAAHVLEHYGGKLPEKVVELRRIPGIGPYTAGAVASIAYGHPEILMDGNVLRVMARVGGVDRDVRRGETQQEIQSQLEVLISRERPGDFNQAMMEIGAIRCLPNGDPLCGDCPLAAFCLAFKQGRTAEIPVKAPKKPRQIQERTILLLEHDGRLAVARRPSGGLLGGLWGFPMIEGKLGTEAGAAWLREAGYGVERTLALGEKKHLFTHLEWHMTGIFAEIGLLPDSDANLWLSPEEIQRDCALPKAFLLYFTGLGHENPGQPGKE